MDTPFDDRQPTPAETSLTESFERPQSEPEWTDAVRRNAMAQFGEFGLPHRRVEAWKYTDVRAKLSGKFDGRPAAGNYADLDARLKGITGDQPAVIVRIVDGQVLGWGESPVSPPAGLSITTFAEALAHKPELVRPFLEQPVDGPAETPRALNTGLAREGVVITAEPGCVADVPIVLAHMAGGEGRPAVHLRHIVHLSAGSSVRLCEVYLGTEETETLSTIVTDIKLEAGSHLAHTKLNLEGSAASHLASTTLLADRAAHYDGQSVLGGSALARLETRTDLAAPEAQVRLGALVLLDGKRHGDITNRVTHVAPHCWSEQDVRAVLAGASRGVIQGAVNVARDAQHTDGHQTIKGLLLSRQSELDTKPELEILADDVKCSHGATSGDLDGEALFYLRARGIPEREARRMLTRAFLEAGLEGFGDEALKVIVQNAMEEWLATHALGGAQA